MSYTNGLDKPSDYFSTKLYTGNGSTNAITGVGFQPDWVWIKNRPDARDHQIYDSVRGTTKVIGSDRTSAEATVSNGLTAFGSDGFTVGADSNVNDNGDSHVAWNWLASNTTASNTQGDITSTVSANTTSGFSIVSYTGTGSTATVGHGLGVQPDLIILKARDRSDNWWVYHKGLSDPSTKAILLNSANAEFSPGTSAFNTSTFSSSVFGILTDSASNASGEDYIAYCMNEKKGFSKFGSYEGNGSTDGTFVYMGFKPAMIIYKRASDGTNNWSIFDNKRDPHNEIDAQLNPNISDAEGTSLRGDFVSNGWKIRTSSGSVNNSGSTYIYMAFAENPFVTSGGIPTTAR